MNVLIQHHPLALGSKISSILAEVGALLEEKDVLIPARDFAPGLREAKEWEKWIALAVSEPDAIVVTTLRVGKATMKLINLAKVKGKRVAFYNGKDLCHVVTVKTVDASDWKSGWMVIYKK